MRSWAHRRGRPHRRPWSGNVSAWADQSGAGDANRNVSQSTPANRPAFNASDADFNGEPSLSFVSANSPALVCGGAFAGGPYAQPLTIYAVLQWTAQGFQYLMDDIDASSRVAILDNFPGVYIYAGASLTNGTLANGVAMVYCAVFDGVSSAVYINDHTTPVLTGDAGTNALKSIVVGANNALANSFDGKLAELVAYSGSHDATQRGTFFTYAGARYGIATS